MFMEPMMPPTPIGYEEGEGNWFYQLVKWISKKLKTVQ